MISFKFVYSIKFSTSLIILMTSDIFIIYLRLMIKQIIPAVMDISSKCPNRFFEVQSRFGGWWGKSLLMKSSY